MNLNGLGPCAGMFLWGEKARKLLVRAPGGGLEGFEGFGPGVPGFAYTFFNLSSQIFCIV